MGNLQPVNQKISRSLKEDIHLVSMQVVNLKDKTLEWNQNPTNVPCVAVTISSHDVIVFRKNQSKNISSLLAKEGCVLTACFKVTARSCPKTSFCKVTGCELKHSTYLHPKPNTSVADKSCGPDASCVPLDSRQPSSSDAFQQSLKNATNAQIDVTGAGVSTVGLPLVPVKVKCAQSSEVV